LYIQWLLFQSKRRQWLKNTIKTYFSKEILYIISDGAIRTLAAFYSQEQYLKYHPYVQFVCYSESRMFWWCFFFLFLSEEFVAVKPIINFTILSTDRFSEVMSSQQMLEFKTLHETFNPLHLYILYVVLASLVIHQSLQFC
jgi:hypothetical protein